MGQQKASLLHTLYHKFQKRENWWFKADVNIQHRKTYLPNISLSSECLKLSNQKGHGWSIVNKITPLLTQRKESLRAMTTPDMSKGEKKKKKDLGQFCNLWGYMYLPQKI